MPDIPRPLSPKALAFKLGIYKHFKGDLYRAFFVARSSEAREEEFVVYQSLTKDYVWIRPLEMFMEDVDRDGYKGPRFSWVGE
ncbi:MAG: hypothetical protein G01um101418_760 [Parcubacteria group bacterium Gr01-1014_18]|nr:MAG: hypothetical protein Greene041636_770 [Parcubacteria group bacterium Greene0416_36]TSC80125.1 MAG: hypothetical protein G01um101418_760 [Parcubacteria group bacterium Gr01-1014_18]TSC99339.1 MAG: hypothetical protein Greene101420_267 [Parcubacteria group bacterium Greene1014_20]TSD06824.1 MAG: hypothetical protein Greene07142_558 [Parcubacteria group bacterium Greene0714_2]